MFIGREKEIQELKEMYASNKMEAMLIYGRRRVGKTIIINESLKDYKGIAIHYECKKVSVESNLEMLTELFCKQLNLSNISFKNFNDFFDYAFMLSKTKNFVLVIDEFTFLLEKDFAIESYLAAAIDKYKEESLIKLVISGSYVGLIEKMTKYGSHSYGRFNHILFIRPFDYYHSSLFYKNYSNEDKFIAYAVFGGLPYFNSLINPKLSIAENIKNLIIKPDSILEYELKQMVLEETSRINNFNDVIRLIASGKTKQSDLIAALKQYDTNDSRYLLSKMQEMDIIQKYTPINEKNNRKKTYYRFKDNFFAFYYKFIALNPYSIMRNNPDYFYEKFIEPNLKIDYLPKKFEEVSREFLLRENLLLRVDPPLMDVGTYFYDDKRKKINRQFDVVTLDEKGYISYECKYSDKPLGIKVINEEVEQVKDLNINFYKLGFISKSGFDTSVDKDKYICYSLDDFYK